MNCSNIFKHVIKTKQQTTFQDQHPFINDMNKLQYSIELKQCHMTYDIKNLSIKLNTEFIHNLRVFISIKLFD